MKKLFFIEIFVYILEIVVTVFLRRDSIFLPLFGYFYVCMCAEQLNKEGEPIFFCFLSGFFYDLLVSSTPFMNTFLFPFIYLITKQFHIYILRNGIAFLFSFVIEIILYRTFTYLVLILIQYQNFTSTRYIKSILSSILFNVLFVICYKHFFWKRKDTTNIYRRKRQHRNNTHLKLNKRKNRFSV